MSGNIVGRGFILEHPGKIVKTIESSVGIGFPYLPDEELLPLPGAFKAVWDTGAEDSMIKDETAKTLGLSQIGERYVCGVGGTFLSKVYLASLFFPNDTVEPSIKLLSCDNDLREDILIGMDIISQGDFLINNFAGETLFSFQVPSTMKMTLYQINELYESYKSLPPLLPPSGDSKANP